MTIKPNPHQPSKPLPVARPGIMDIEPYKAGKAKIEGQQKGPIYKLSSNESALGASPKAIAAYVEASFRLHLYPDSSVSALRQKISDIHALDPERIICGAGSDEILQLLCRAYLGEGDNIVQSRHGFLIYGIAAQSCGAHVKFAPEKNLHTDVDAILECVDERTRLVFIANPNNPTGTYISHSEVTRLHENLPKDIVLVLDAAYAEYINESDYDSGIKLVQDNHNVIMTRTFSKIYGLGSLRLGWAFGPATIIDVLNRIRGPFNISHAAQQTGIAAMDDQEFITQNNTHNKTERDIMIQRLNGMGINGAADGEGLVCQNSFANFILVKFPRQKGNTAQEVQTYLQENGVLVREMSGYHLPDYLRISIGSREANQKLISLLCEKFET